MKKKAFTLMELLAVIVVLAIILVIAVPRILNIIETTRENSYQLSMDLMRRAAETYVQSGKAEITGSTAVITLNELVNNGYMSPIKDVKDKSTECIGYVEVTIGESGTTYEPCLKCGSNFVSENYDPVLAGEEAPKPENANVHVTTVPDGYTAIYKVEDLNNIRNNLSGKYILMNNLDFNSDSSYTNPSNKSAYTTGNGWDPIGTASPSFTGTFDGNNYTISNLFINRPSSTQVGLFGYISSASAISKIGLKSASITGATSYAGALTGYSTNATISNCYATGTVTSTGSFVGGLIGYSYSTTVNNSYVNVTVTGNGYAGGLISYIASSTIVNNSFSAGDVVATAGSGAYYGRLIGRVYSGTVNNSYYNGTSSLTGTGTIGLSGTTITSSYLKTEMFINYTLGWDVQNIWDVSTLNYPTLGGTTLVPNGNAVAEIDSIEDLYSVRKNLAGTYILTKDLDFNNDSSYRNANNKTAVTSGEGWITIGNSGTRFTGTFNGNGHTISNLYANNTNKDNMSLLGYAGSSAVIEKVGLISATVIGSTYTGGLVGTVYGATVNNCFSTGTVTGTNSMVGGLVGYLNGTVNNSYSTATVSATSDAGGLVGHASSGNINNSYGAGNVTATQASSAYYGRLLGRLYSGTVTNSYYNSASTITGVGTITNSGTPISNSYLKTEAFINYTLGWDVNTIWNATAYAYPTFGGNAGLASGAVYQITKIEDLYSVRKNLTGSYTLMNDLDFNSDSSYRNANNKTAMTTEQGWISIGSGDFTGTFNGNGHKISNLFVNNTNGYGGLFERPYGATIEKLGLENVNVTAKYYTGGLSANMGVTSSTIRNIYVTGNVTSTDSYAGGLAGYIYSANISNSYSTANITGKDYAGGLAGQLSYGSISNSFATGNIATTVASGAYYGKIIGRTSYATTTNSYYNSASTLTGVGTVYTTGTAVSNSHLKTEVFINYSLGWDVNTIWDATAYAYPKFGGDAGLVASAVYQITKIEDLYSVRKDLAGSYTLMNDLDFNSDSSYRNANNKTAMTTGVGWIPIGSNNFTGTFNGNNHKIKNLYVNSPDSLGGLFATPAGSTIEKLGLENVNVTGYGYSGGLAGSVGVSTSTIRNIYVTGSVTSTNSYAGGLFGYGYSANLSNSYSTSTVTGKDYAGGLIGMQSYGSISNSFATGSVTATAASGTYFGRFTAYSGGYATKTNCYYDGSSTLNGTGTTVTTGTSSTVANIQPLTLTGLSTWDTTSIWQVNTGSYPTFK